MLIFYRVFRTRTRTREKERETLLLVEDAGYGIIGRSRRRQQRELRRPPSSSPSLSTVNVKALFQRANSSQRLLFAISFRGTNVWELIHDEYIGRSIDSYPRQVGVEGELGLELFPWCLRDRCQRQWHCHLLERENEELISEAVYRHNNPSSFLPSLSVNRFKRVNAFGRWRGVGCLCRSSASVEES